MEKIIYLECLNLHYFGTPSMYLNVYGCDGKCLAQGSADIGRLARGGSILVQTIFSSLALLRSLYKMYSDLGNVSIG